jgi:hypothetical protein
VVGKEKGLTLAPALATFNLHSVDGNIVNISIDDTQNQKVFNLHEKYIEKKTEEYFGKKLRFTIMKKGKLRFAQKNKQILTTSSSVLEKREISDPYEDIIINELDGEKIE